MPARGLPSKRPVSHEAGKLPRAREPTNEKRIPFMNSDLFRNLLIKFSVGGLLGVGVGFGCVIGPGCQECGDALCDSHMEQQDENGDGVLNCVCDEGYEWENPNDPNNFECEPAPPKPSSPSDCVESYHVLVQEQCYCVSGYAWCNPSDNDDLSCCPTGGTGDDGGPGPGDDDGGSGSGSGTDGGATSADETGGGGECSEDPPPFVGFEPVPEDCTTEVEGGLFCSNTAEQGPAGSMLWTCTGGRWVESPEQLQADCEFQGAEFVHGCVDNGTDIEILCGNGPGTFCSGDACNACADDDVLNTCEYGNKLEATSCATFCQEIGIDGITFETGFCDSDDQGPFCSCCDSGDEGCPI